MNRLIARTCGLLRTLVTFKGHQIKSESIKKRTFYSLVTSVSGFDNKHTHYKTQIRPRWIYGDDACFISVTEASCVLGVADGVGGWRSYGVDPSSFSKTFMSNCERLAKSGRFQPDEPMLLVRESYQEVLEAKTPLLGSATFCVISLCRDDGRLYTVCLGDSGYLVIRHGAIVQRSYHQKHDLNTPFQVACLPPNDHGQFHRDAPDQAIQDIVILEPGDVLVVGTDGLFDNLTDDMIVQELSPLQEYKSQPASDDLEWCATRLVDCARLAAKNPNFVSPFANEARQYGLNIAGGIRGDITVMLAIVVNEEISADSPTKAGDTSSPSAAINQHDSATTITTSRVTLPRLLRMRYPSIGDMPILDEFHLPLCNK